MKTITNITTTVFRLPMYGALQWGKHSKLAEARHVLVQVELSDGSWGYAEAPPRPTIYGETTQSICSVIERELAPRLIGMAADAPESLLPRLHEIKYNFAAKGGVDIALHAALAQSKGQTLAQHLGCSQEKLRVSYILGIGDRETVLAEAQRVVEQGVRVLKVKVGRQWEEDLERIDDLHTLFGDAVDLYADANECLEADEAPHKLDILRERGLLYCEEPLPVESIQERAQLRAGEHLPLIADDSTFTLRDLRRELALDTFDILNIKTARTGYSESQQMLQLALQANKGVMIGSQASASLGTLQAACIAALPGVEHPSELSFFLKLQADITDRPLVLHDGYLYLSEAINLQVDPAKLKEFSVE
ncbi:MAG: enolase C-terminal domain-like protein [Caldilineaceae bacterium]